MVGGMSPLVVQKYGGTSVADPERIRQVADHVARTHRQGSDVVIHDASDLNLSFALSRLSTQDLTHTVTGVFRRADRPTYDDSARAQVNEAKAAKAADLSKLLHGKDTWTVVG